MILSWLTIGQAYSQKKISIWSEGYATAVDFDQDGRARIDDWEMKPEVQDAVAELWETATNENFQDISDYEGYKSEFLKLFGFGFDSVDYTAETDPERDFS